MEPIHSILLVEDNPQDVELTLAALGEHHLANEVVVATDGEEALDYLHRRGRFKLRTDGNPAVVLLDLKMPKVDGLEVLREIKQNERLRNIPVVMLTSSREEQDLIRSYGLGVNAYVVKPVDFQGFVEAVRQIGIFWAVHNEPPPGTRPRPGGAEGGRRRAMTRQVSAAAPDRPLRLLHLEDSPADAELIHLTLAEAWPGCRIDRVATEAEFAAALGRGGIDLILSDFSIPGFNGLEALELARRLGAGIPFLFLSGTIGEDNAVEALKRGAVDYVIKDRMGRLVPAVRRALEEVAQQRSRQRAEHQLRDQAELLDKAHDAIYVRDLDDRVLYWNRSAERIYGYSAAEVEERRASDLGFLQRNPDSFADAKRILLQRGEWTGEFRAISKSHQEFEIMARRTLVRDEAGAPRSILCIDTDITEQKKMETQFLRAQRLESVGMLAGGIAHDLNNVLAPILMAVGLLQQQCKDQDIRHLLEVLETSAQHGAGLIRQVLAFARGVEGERAALQPYLIVRDVVQLLTETLPRSIALESQVPRELWLVNSSSTQLSQVVMNLCVNARDAIPRGGTILVRARNVEVDEALAAANPGAQAGPHVLISVADTGSGIPAEVREHIFDPFFTTKIIGKGTGLGLSTVLGIVKSHGGFLELQSEVGRGTEFRLYFPATADSAAPKERAPETALPDGHGEAILVIEDEVGVRTVVHDLLQARGYRVLTADDGPAGAGPLPPARAGRSRAVVTDMMMPDDAGRGGRARIAGAEPRRPPRGDERDDGECQRRGGGDRPPGLPAKAHDEPRPHRAPSSASWAPRPRANARWPAAGRNRRGPQPGDDLVGAQARRVVENLGHDDQLVRARAPDQARPARGGPGLGRPDDRLPLRALHHGLLHGRPAALHGVDRGIERGGLAPAAGSGSAAGPR